MLFAGDSEEEMSIFQQNEELSAALENEKEKNEMTDEYSPPDEPGYVLQSFGESNFKREYEWVGRNKPLLPEHKDRLLFAVRRVVEGYCDRHGVHSDVGERFVNELQDELS